MRHRGKFQSKLRGVLRRSNFAIIAACAVSIACSRATPGVTATVSGFIKGNFAVTPNGEAAYSMEILVPPGIKKMQPRLTLSYNSSAGNGRLGVGWKLTGLSAITRCKATPAVDGFRGTVTYGADDRYCIDGQRLINIAGANGSAGSEYRTQLETWRRVQASTELCGGGPCSFTVTTRDGSTWSYGTSSDSAILAANRADVRVWALKQVTDLDGNGIAYSYTLDPLRSGNSSDGEYYISEIDYTGNAKAAVAANRSLTFRYAARPDVATRYVGGSAVTTRWRLAAIDTAVQTAIVHEYRLGYHASAPSGHSLLDSIALCDGTGTDATCLSPTTMAWPNAPPAFNQTSLMTALPGGAEQIIPADVNGDGRGDLLHVSASQGSLVIQPYVSTGADLASCGTALSIPANRQPLYTLDIDGSGKAALLQLVNQGQGAVQVNWYQVGNDNCSYSGAGSFTPSPALQMPPDRVWQLDIDGDGRTDLVLGWFSQGQLSLTTLRSTGSSFEVVGSTAITPAPNGQFMAIDTNGDGMVDLVQVGFDDSGNTLLTSFLSNGSTFVTGKTSTIAVAGAPGNVGFWPIDVNRDGNTSIVQGWMSGGLNLTILAADGTGGFVAQSTTATGRDIVNADAFWPSDVMGVGETGLVQVQSSGGQLNLVIYRNTGQGFDSGTDAGTSLASSDFHHVWAIDLAGTGRMGLMQGVSQSGTLALQQNAIAGSAPDLVAAFTNGLGDQTSIAYKPLSDPSVYTAASAQYPKTAVGHYSYRSAPAQGPFQRVGGGTTQLVSSYVQSNPAATGAATYRYQFALNYAGGVNDLSGYGWLGFASMTKTDLQTGFATLTNFNQAFPLTGTVASIVKQCNAAFATDPLCPPGVATTTLSASTVSYRNDVTATGATAPNPPVYQSLKTAVRLQANVYGAPDYARGKTYHYDTYGNVVQRHDLGYIDAKGAPLDPAAVVHTCMQYGNDAAAWVFGHLTDIKVSSSASCNNNTTFVPGTDFSLEHISYTPTWQILKQSAWDNSNNVFLTTTFGYDPFGNVVSITEPGNRTTSTTFEPTFNTFALARASPANAQGLSLTETFSFDPRFGTHVGYRDTNGVVKITCTDTFGRITAHQGPLPDSGGLSDPNCLTQGATGPRAAFAAAKVATLITVSRQSDTEGRNFIETDDRQNWGSTNEPVTWQWKRAYVDGLARAYETVNQDLSTSGNVFICVGFDSANRITRTAVPFFAAGKFVDCPASAGPPQNWSTAAYDVYGRPTRMARPSGPVGSPPAIATVAYSSGDTTTITYAAADPYSYVKQLTFGYFNSKRRLVRMIVPGDGNATTRFGYDPIGRMVSATDPPTAANAGGVVNDIAYDSLDRRVSIDNPDQNTTGGKSVVAMSYTYDPANGFLSSTRDARGQTVTFQRDLLGRVTSQLLSDGTAYAFTYDAASAPNANGRLSLVTATRDGTPLFEHSYGYGPYGEQSQLQVKLNGSTYNETTAFDPQRRALLRTYPDGSALTQTWEMGHLSSQQLDANPIARYPSYSTLGHPLSVAYGNGVTGGYQYDPTGELSEWSVTGPNGKPLLDLALTWDHLTQLAKIDDKLKSGGSDFSQTLTRTSARLVAAAAPGIYGTLNFSYDASGNLCIGSAKCSYTAHRLTAMTGGQRPEVGLTYDASGNIKTKTAAGRTWTYGYDSLSHLNAATRNGRQVFAAPVYDHRGRRLVATVGGTTTTYVTPDYEIETRNGGTSATKYIASQLGTVATITSTQQGGATTVTPLYLHQDQVASTTLTTDASGNPAARLAYAPFGGVARSSGSINVTRKFQNQPLDRSTGLYYFGARYFDPSIGRFMTPDSRVGASFTTADSINRFAFAVNNPTTYIDNFGHSIWDKIAAGLIGGLEVLAGVALDVLSDGALEPVGNMLVGTGIGSIQYTATAGSNFSWKQYGIQTAIGVATGMVPGGGEEADAGAAAAEESAENEVKTSVEDSAENQIADGGATEERLDSGSRAEDAPESAKNEAGDVETPESEEDSEGDDDTCTGNLLTGTRVVTSDGPKRIERIRRADRVLAFDQRTGRPKLATVTGVSRRTTAAVSRITAGGKTIAAAATQLFHVAGRGWVEALQIQAGDRLDDRNGNGATVERAEIEDKPAEVIGIEVADLHSFYAGDKQLLAHNGKCKSKRDKAMGRTPNKHSPTGKKVFKRMQDEGNAKIDKSGSKWVKVKIKNNGPRVWKPLDRNIHMGHIEGAVEWWNKNNFAAKATEVRTFMLDDENYELEFGPLNSSNGAISGQTNTYHRPLGWKGPW